MVMTTIHKNGASCFTKLSFSAARTYHPNRVKKKKKFPRATGLENNQGRKTPATLLTRCLAINYSPEQELAVP
jgi:hypothetical protein